MTTIGVLALQGDFAEHIAALKECGVIAKEIRRSEELKSIDGLIIPGGESTAIAKLTGDNTDPIFDTIRQRIESGMSVWGTCMGSIFLAKEIEGSQQGKLGVMDITVKRNAFGPQRNSFETSLSIPVLGLNSFPSVFIRAPLITRVGSGVEVLARVQEGIVMARQGNLLVTSFHPEVTPDLRLHHYFISMVEERIPCRVVEGAVSRL